MPNPTRSDVHVNRPLTNISIAYIQKQEDFIADKVFPVVPVMKQSDLFFTYDKKSWFSTQAKRRAPGTESAGSGYKVSASPSYFAHVHAVHKDVDDQTRANADDPLDLDRDSTLWCTQQMMLRRELDFFNSYFSLNTWTGYQVSGSPADFAPTNAWNSSTGNPLQDIDNLKSQVKSQTGFMPNTLVVTNDVFFALRNNPVVVDRIKYTQRGLLSEDLLASLFGVSKFLVANAVQDTAPEGEAGSMGFIKSNLALLTYSAPSPSILQPSAGYTFSWKGMYGAGAEGARISSFRMEQIKSDRIEGEMAYDLKMVGSDLGVLLKTLIV